MVITIPPNITLLRLVINNPDKFYPQDWYYDEEFANTPLRSGNCIVSDAKKYPAAMYAYAYVHRYYVWDYAYIWTSDKDSRGDRVYVGGVAVGKRHKGLQIHRHLTIDPANFVNTID
jgi:hypothetical protein